MYISHSFEGLKRKSRAGMSTTEVDRQKRMSDMAWQMQFSMLKLKAIKGTHLEAREKLLSIHRRAKREYNRLKFEIDMNKEGNEDFWMRIDERYKDPNMSTLGFMML